MDHEAGSALSIGVATSITSTSGRGAAATPNVNTGARTARMIAVNLNCMMGQSTMNEDYLVAACWMDESRRPDFISFGSVIALWA